MRRWLLVVVALASAACGTRVSREEAEAFYARRTIPAAVPARPVADDVGQSVVPDTAAATGDTAPAAAGSSQRQTKPAAGPDPALPSPGPVTRTPVPATVPTSRPGPGADPQPSPALPV